VAELSSIVERIEDGAIGLEETLAQRQRGEALIRRCRAILERAEQDLQATTPEELDASDGA
jgi:exodeoxyribonuclease VII small subunit